MSHSPLFRNLQRLIALALESSPEKKEEGVSRRDFLRQSGRAAGLAVAGTTALMLPFGRARAAGTDVAIVGGGLAGLTCAYELRKNGVASMIYEAATRTGGRQWSMTDKFPGQSIERGGELIDNLHKTMIGYAQEFGLTLEDVNKNSGEVAYFFNGQHYSEDQVVEEFRVFVDAMRGDLRRISGEPSAEYFTPEDQDLDYTSLDAYLDGENSLGLVASPVVRAAIEQAYLAEYGQPLALQSSLNFLLFIHADRRSKFTPFGVYSDERYHVVEGNEAIARGIASRLPGQITLGHRLVRARKTSGGRIELTFKVGNQTVTRVHDAVVFAIPFTTLRLVELDASLGIPANQRDAIANLGYGNNAKMMVGFNGRPWKLLGSNGASYSDLPNHQATWETNWTRASATRGVLTDYSSADRGLNLNPSRPQQEAQKFLADLDRVYPGAAAMATRDSQGRYLVHLEHWPSNPNSLGSYTCYYPGQFTTICGLEGKAVGNVFFAGEHANSFYEWQGFMEGACLSGLKAAADILAKVKKGGSLAG